MHDFDGRIAAARAAEQSGEEGEYVRRARQHEDLQHLYDAIECCAHRRRDGWGAERGEMHEVILKRKGRVVGTWCRSGADFVFRYPRGAKPPVVARSFQDLSRRTAEIIADNPGRPAWRLARLIRTGPKGQAALR